MMLRYVWVFLAVFVSAQAQAQAACTNPIATIAIPSNGSINVVVCDQSGNNLNGPFSIQINGINVTATTSPAVTVSGANLIFTPNMAVSGSAGNFNICFTPANKCNTIPYTVGAPVTSVSFGTP